MLKFNTLLHENGIDPKSVQLVRHKDRGPSGTTPYSLLRNTPAQFDAYQAIQARREVFRREFIASFVVGPAPASETLFVNLYQVVGPEKNAERVICPVREKAYDPGQVQIYNLSVDVRLIDFSQRLIISWGEGYRSWVQRADKQNKNILEIRRQFEEPKFPDYPVFKEKIEDIPTLYPTRRAVLTIAKGVYLLVCNKTGAQYVGSASGDQGFFGRWTAYAADGHGGNKLLKERGHKDYTVSILETVGSNIERRKILELEILWKEKLGSRAQSLGDEFGLNAN